MLKKIFMATVAVLIIVASENCFAELALVRLTVGGITIGTEIDWVKNTYGEPTKIYETVLDGSRDACHEYNNGNAANLRLIYNRSRIVQIICSGKNDFRTFDGVKIGDPISVITAVYGTPDETGTPPVKVRRNARADNYILYNSTSKPYKLMFLTKRRKIVAIMSGIIDR